MRPLITPARMRDMEKRYFAETGTPSIDLMERASSALRDALIARYGENRTFFFACGPGGNGGDGYACARLLAARGARCAVIPAAPPATPDAIENLRRAREAGVMALSVDDVSRSVSGRTSDVPSRWADGSGGSAPSADAPDVWVDALYGTGLSRAPEGDAARLIDLINAHRAAGGVTVAVDIPSGLNGATGRAYSPCVHADLTVTFQFAKTGHWLADGLDLCGEIEVADIGIPAAFHPEDMAALMEDGDVTLPHRPRNTHKGRSGRLLIVAGSMGMAGAAALCAESALRGGAGLVTVAAPASVVPILQTLVPCAMALPMPERDGAFAPEAADALADALAGVDAVVCGCGLSRRAAPEVVCAVLSCGKPALLDADALNLIAEDASLRPMLSLHHLITPHPGEAARLLGQVSGDPIADALALRALGCAALLKGATTVIPMAGRAVLSASGGNGMATGGSGDCLSGLIGALMAERAALDGGIGLTASHGNDRAARDDAADLTWIAAIGSHLHGLAGEAAQARLGARGMTARDIALSLPEVLARYE